MRLFLLFILTPLMLAACDKAPKLGLPTESELASAAQEDCGYVQNSYGQRVSWKNNLPISILLDSSFPSNYESALYEAAKQWEQAVGKTLFSFSRNSSKSQNVITWQTTWDETQKNMQAVTSLRWYKNFLTEAKIKIDARYYNFYTNAPSSGIDIHLQSLLVHELGHALGMKHKAISPTVMWATLGGSTVRQELSATDIKSLKCEY